jgi:hypothetical protein
MEASERAFSLALKHHGVDVSKVPQESNEGTCGECGATYRWNVYGMDEAMRAEWRAVNASTRRLFASRLTPTEAELRRVDDLCEREAARCRSLYGEHYTEAQEAARAAMMAWMDEHNAEVVAAWQRAPLVQRRGLAA